MDDIKIKSVEVTFKLELINCSIGNGFDGGIITDYIITLNDDSIVKFAIHECRYSNDEIWEPNVDPIKKEFVNEFIWDQETIDWVQGHKNSFVLKRLEEAKSYNWKMEKDNIWNEYIVKKGYANE